MTNTAISRKDSKALKQLLAAIEALKRGMPPLTTLEQARTFVLVCLEEGLTGVEYRKVFGVPQATVSRHLLDLGDWRRNKVPGMQLIEQKIEVADLRSKRYFLTPKGRKLLNEIESTTG